MTTPQGGCYNTNSGRSQTHLPWAERTLNQMATLTANERRDAFESGYYDGLNGNSCNPNFHYFMPGKNRLADTEYNKGFAKGKREREEGKR